MSTDDVQMADGAATAAAPAAATSAAPAPASPFAFHCTHLPTGCTLHLAYLRGLAPEQVAQLRTHSSEGKEFALLNADHIVGLFQLECSGVKTSLQAQRAKLKTKNIHLEFTFNLGSTGHFQTASEFLNAKSDLKKPSVSASSVGPPPAVKQQHVLVCVMHASDLKLAAVQKLLEPMRANQADLALLREKCNVTAITKNYKIVESELQTPLPSTPYQSGVPTPPSENDPFLLAVIGRIHLKI